MASAPQRVSGLAVASLVCGLLCCLPGVGAVAAVLGVGGLMGISRSQGRVTGSGFAATGIALGVLGTIFWIGAAITGRNFYNGVQFRLIAPAEEFGVAIEQGDLTTARSVMSPGVTMDDAAFRAFSAKVKDKLGARQGLSKNWSIFETFSNRSSNQNRIEGLVKRTAQVPLPLPAQLKFEKGEAVAIAFVASGDFLRDFLWGNKSLRGEIVNMVLLTDDGQEIWLIDPPAVPAAGGGPSRRMDLEIPDQDPELKPKAPTPPEAPGTPTPPTPRDPR